MSKKPQRTLQILVAAFCLVLVVQSFIWFRFSDVQVFDSDDEFNPDHNVESYWDDDLDREVKISWSRRNLSESFLMQAAGWEAIDFDERDEIFVTSAREACAA